MVLAGLNAPAAYLDLTRRLSDETELAVWDSVIGSLRFIDDQFGDRPGGRAFAIMRAICSGPVQPSGMGAAA